MGSAACQAAKRKKRGQLEDVTHTQKSPVPSVSSARQMRRGSAASTASTAMSEARKAAEKRKLLQTTSLDTDPEKTPKKNTKRKTKERSRSDLGSSVRKIEPEIR